MSDKLKEVEALAKQSGQSTLPAYKVAEEYAELHRDELLFCSSWQLFLLYNGKFFQLVSKDQMLKKIYEYLRKNHPKQNRNQTQIKNIFDTLKNAVNRNVIDIELDHNYFAFNDKILNTDTLEYEPHSNTILCFKHIDISIDDDNEIPNFTNYISTSLVDSMTKEPDKDLIDLYQEMFGSLFSHEMSSRVVFFLKGDGDNGKSVTTELLERIFEEQNISALSLQNLSSERFGKQGLVGKTLNLCSEEESMQIKNDTFKALVTTDLVQGERKYEPSFNFHNYAHFVFAMNSTPLFKSLGYAMKKRLCIIPWHAQFPKGHPQRDNKLIGKLYAERAGIIKWALDGLERLQKNDFMFTDSKMAAEEMRNLEGEVSSVVLYFQENWKKSETIKTTTEDFFELYDAWCKKYNNHAKKKLNVGKDLMDLGLKPCRAATGRGYYMEQVNRGLVTEEEIREEEEKLQTNLPY